MMEEKQTVLMNKFPYLCSSLSALENETDGNKLEILNTKVENAPTISVSIENRPYYLHSKYDPKKEAQFLIERYKDELEQYDHVLFYGVGLGYHVEALLKRYPNMNYSLFEPVPSVFKHFLESNRLDTLDLSRLKNIYIDTQNDNSKDFLINITETIQERIILIPLPSYERIFEHKSKIFAEEFKAAIATKYESHYIDNKYSARWTLNSLINLPTTLSTPNILNGFDHVFKDKPLIIVSAGPSLQDEYENLKKIKKDKTAYIFAVGSANKALIANGIIPDAVCTYDPQDINHTVFTKMLEENVVDVPMIYGTSVGFETLKHYPGPKLHMITTQDTVTPFYIANNQDEIERINDAPTIAAVTLQLACKLGCSPVIFVGQNLALIGKQIYSENIKDNELEIDKENIIIVEDVNGQKIQTTKGFLNMKSYLEYYLNYYKDVEFINSTKGGAAINGARFKSLEDVMRTRLKTEVVKEDWYKQDVAPMYNTSEIISKTKLMEQSIDDFWKLNDQLFNALQEMKKLVKRREIRKLDKAINLFNIKMNRFLENVCYKIYIHPVNRTFYQALTIRTAEIRKEADIIKKSNILNDVFSPYLDRCRKTMEQICLSIYKVHHDNYIRLNSKSLMFYSSDCGVFQFEGNWHKEIYSPGKRIDYRVNKIVTRGNSKMKFKFTGGNLKILGRFIGGNFNHFNIIIDGKVEKISKSKNFTKYNEVLYEKYYSPNEEHLVTIEIMKENTFELYGVEAEKYSQLYHIDEVTDMKDLKVGKRIRCHYKATYNKLGQFCNIGKATYNMLNSDPDINPQGDFFFIMIDEKNGQKELVADRVIQNFISWKVIKEGLANNDINRTFKITLPTGIEEDKLSDCKKILILEEDHLNNKKNHIMWNYDSIASTWIDESFYCDLEQKLTYVGFRGSNHGTEDHNFSKIWKRKENTVERHVGFRPKLIIKNSK